jgi:L-lactate dehydrogenase complex protein LldG
LDPDPQLAAHCKTKFPRVVEGSTMSERERILARIREALTLSAPVAGHAHGEKAAAPSLPTPADQRRVLPAVGETFEAQVALFAKNAADLRADFKPVADLAALTHALKALAIAEKWRRVASHAGGLSKSVAESLGLPVLLTDSELDKNELEQCDVGISECDALVAQTGSVVVTSRSAGGRALSCLPPHHVVVARREQLVADLPAAFALIKSKFGANYPSMISFITGPSRTGDIERILVLGAHGPKKLTIFCVE